MEVCLCLGSAAMNSFLAVCNFSTSSFLGSNPYAFSRSIVFCIADISFSFLVKSANCLIPLTLSSPVLLLKISANLSPSGVYSFGVSKMSLADSPTLVIKPPAAFKSPEGVLTCCILSLNPEKDSDMLLPSLFTPATPLLSCSLKVVGLSSLILETGENVPTFSICASLSDIF